MKYLFKARTFTFFLLIFLFYSSFSWSKNTNLIYSEKNISNYFSGIISINENNTSQAFNFLKKTQLLQDEHSEFNEQFLRTLILLGKFNEAFDYINNLSSESADFFEANLFSGLNHFVKKDYLNAEKYFKKLKQSYIGDYYIEDYFVVFLNSIVKVSQNNLSGSLQMLETIPDSLDNLKKMQEALIHCHFDSPNTISLFEKLIKNKESIYPRHNFFLANHHLYKNNIKEAEHVISRSYNEFASNMLIRQSYDFMIKKSFKEIKKFFDCKDPKDLMSEFFYVIANLYSAQENYSLSNFYLKISIYLNENFYSNRTLLAENYLSQFNNEEAREILYSVKKIGSIYSWYANKRIAYIISLKENKKKGAKYLENEIKKIKNPNFHNYHDLGNFFKSGTNYEKSIKYYSLALKKIDENHKLRPKILHKRGTSYERLGIWDKAEKDFKKSLELKPDQPYVLNYLAYSWLEKRVNLEESLEMLKKADFLKQNDGYIIDSLGWGFYLNNDYVEAERLLRRAVELMPTEPVIIDHYADILWKLNKNIQARYFWKQAQNLESSDKEFIDTIGKKIIFGLVEGS